MITEAEYLNRLDMAAVNAVVSANPGRRGAKLMEAAAGRRHRTRSTLEQRFLRLPEWHRVEEPETGIWIEGYETDFLWRDAHLVVELDGLAAHRTTAAMKGDRRRDRILWRAAFRTMRLTEDDLDEPEAVLDDLAHAGVSVPSRSRASSKPPRRSRISSASVR